ncbi:MAG TPA: AAA family ATPase [Vicinamibacterales bacterium]|nr:AAA family ATPase [Vicinamibacterales bacterium]
MAALHFICGKAGSGKTTLARKLGRDLPAVVICEDEWLSRIAEPINNLSDYLKAAARCRSVLAPHVAELLKLGVSVVFDFAGNTRRDRLWVRSIFETAGADHVLHYLPAADATCRARVHLRNETRPDGVFFGVVTDEQVDEVNRYFDAPGVDERFNVVEHDVADTLQDSSRSGGASMTTHLAADLAVTLPDDRPGMLSKAISCIGAAGINIDGYSEMNGVVHVLTTDLAAARQCLTNAGFREVQEQDVVVVPVSDEPGAAARVFQRIADAHINVRYSYLATRSRLVIASSDPSGVIKAITE